MHKFQVGDIVEQDQKGGMFKGRRWEVVKVCENEKGLYGAKVIRFADKNEYKTQLGKVENYMNLDSCCFLVAPKPKFARDSRGRFANKLTRDAETLNRENAKSIAAGNAFLDTFKGAYAVKVWFTGQMITLNLAKKILASAK